MKQKLSKQNLLLVGFTLFSMFFGAGNLIFPPFLGAQAGVMTWKAMSGFLLSAVGLPVLGVAAVALSGGIGKLAGRVHPAFAFLFTLLIYLSIGPCLAIPRTSSTSFEMTVFPVLKQLGVSFNSTVRGTGFTVQTMAQFGYSVVVFYGCHGSGIQAGEADGQTGKDTVSHLAGAYQRYFYSDAWCGPWGITEIRGLSISQARLWQVSWKDIRPWIPLRP